MGWTLRELRQHSREEVEELLVMLGTVKSLEKRRKKHHG